MNNRIKVLMGTVIFIIVIIVADRVLKMRSTSFVNENGNNESNTKIYEDEAVIEVTTQSFEEEVLQSEKIVLIDFYAKWCGPCQMLSPIVEEIAHEQKEVKFVKIDVDKNEKLASKYGIQYIPTLVVIENGKEINRNVGLIRKDKILELIQK